MFAVEVVFWEGGFQVGLLPCVFEAPLSLQFTVLSQGRNSIQLQQCTLCYTGQMLLEMLSCLLDCLEALLYMCLPDLQSKQ